MAANEHRAQGHRCPSFVLDERECELMSRTGEYDYETYDDYKDPEDATFWIPHQQEPRMVQFNRLTVTIDHIISRCGYPESERERLTALHRRLAEEFLADYRGPLNGPVPLLEKTQASPLA
ncbi:MAG: hypothetical protein F4Z41_03615 [Acidimicrobiia bacterium]|nr:hypothetical protein [Acidimicrobiia bacterium]MXX45277.1 hypothetical protein [Acidimicrobiia bacterium]MYJ16132.1 hypothetical protein [Acidimicrobiia bacterium]